MQAPLPISCDIAEISVSASCQGAWIWGMECAGKFLSSSLFTSHWSYLKIPHKTKDNYQSSNIPIESIISFLLKTSRTSAKLLPHFSLHF